MRVSILLASILLTGTAQAQYRNQTERGSMELAFDHGYGGGSEGGYFELAGDLRIWAPFGLGAILRIGAASNVWSTAYAGDLGAGVRFHLVDLGRAGLDLSMGAGASVAGGPFDGEVVAFGGFGIASLDLWHRHGFVGIGLSAHVMQAEIGCCTNREDPLVWTIAPVLRLGGDWGL